MFLKSEEEKPKDLAFFLCSPLKAAALVIVFTVSLATVRVRGTLPCDRNHSEQRVRSTLM